MVDSAANRPAPTANGTLAKTPLVHLLLYVAERKLSGTLELLSPDKRGVTIVFVGGQPAKVRTSEPVAYLGRVLHEMGLLTEDQLTRSLAELAREKGAGHKLHGELLIAQGIVDAAKVQKGLREQVARKLRHAAGLPATTVYGYYDGFDALKNWGREATEGIDPFAVLWTMLREAPPWEHVHAALQKVGTSLLRVRGGETARFGLGADEMKMVESMRTRPLRSAELAAAGPLPEQTGQLLSYLLLITKQVDVLAAEGQGRQGSAPASASALPAAPAQAPRISSPPVAGAGRSSARAPAADASLPSVPPALSGENAARWKEIVERARAIDRADYFSMLGVARDEGSEAIEAAYFALAKIWHPDRLPAELAPVRGACARVFSRMSEARATLTDAAQRERYLTLVAEGSGTPETQETVARVVDASTHFQKAEVCFKRNDLAQAEEFCRKALELDPSQPDYHAMLAWLIALKPDHQSESATMQSIRMLDRAIQLSNRCEKAYFWRGMLYKRLGKTDQAARDFRRACDLNPRNIDAAREVRLHTMRGGRNSNPPPPPPGRDSSPPAAKAEDKPGLFGRLFKR